MMISDSNSIGSCYQVAVDPLVRTAAFFREVEDALKSTEYLLLDRPVRLPLYTVILIVGSKLQL